MEIPISAAKEIAHKYDYDQVIIIGRKVGIDGNEHVTTYGKNKTHCNVAARAGDFLKFKIMGWVKENVKDYLTSVGSKEKRSKKQIDELVSRYVKKFEDEKEDSDEAGYATESWEKAFGHMSNLKGLALTDEKILGEQYDALCQVGTVYVVPDGFAVATKKVTVTFTRWGMSLTSPKGVPRKRTGIVDYGRIRPALFELYIKDDYVNIVSLLSQFVEMK